LSQILVEGITKIFKVSKRREGLLNALLGIFYREHAIIKALDNISFEIREGELVGYMDTFFPLLLFSTDRLNILLYLL